MIKLMILLKELNIQPKDPIGQGIEQTVYPSKIKPGFVIKKLGGEDFEEKDEWTKDEWIKRIQTAQQHPEVFAKIDKVDFDKEYMVQEKLDEASLTRDLYELNNYLIKNNLLNKDYWFLEDILDILVQFPDQINILDNTPYEKTLKPKLEDFLKRLKTAGFGKDTGNIISDVRISNVGYDTAGKIKILDFHLGSY